MSERTEQLWNQWLDLPPDRQVSVAHQLFPYLVGVMSCLPDSAAQATDAGQRFEQRWSELQMSPQDMRCKAILDVADVVTSKALKGGITA